MFTEGLNIETNQRYHMRIIRRGAYKNAISSDEKRLRAYFKSFGDANMGLIYAVIWDTAKPEERDAIEWIIRDVLPSYSPKAAKVARSYLNLTDKSTASTSKK